MHGAGPPFDSLKGLRKIRPPFFLSAALIGLLVTEGGGEVLFRLRHSRKDSTYSAIHPLCRNVLVWFFAESCEGLLEQ